MTEHSTTKHIQKQNIATYKDVVELLNYIESTIPVQKWRLKHHFIWPLVKIQLSFALLSELRDTQKAKQCKTKVLSPDYPQRTILKSFKNYLKDILSIIKLYFKARGRKYIFYGALSHREKLNDKHLNKFYHPIIEDLLSKGTKVLQIEYTAKNEYDKINLPFCNGVIFADDYFRAFNKLHLFFYKKQLKRNKHLPGLSNIHTILQAKYSLPDRIFEILEGVKTLENNHYFPLYLFHKFVAKTANPTISFGLCYYDVSMLAMFAAFNHSGVKTIEIQHGPQSPFHPAYAKQLNAPAGGYLMQPSVYWVWDESTAKNLTQGICYLSERRILRLGNPWHQFWLRNEANPSNSYHFDNNLILICLSPFQSYLEDFVIETIKRTYTQYNWWIRIHPRQKSVREDILDFFKEKEILHLINYKEATEYSLPLILNHTKLHITKVSGTTIEAATFNVPTILTHKLGATYYSEQVKQGIAIYLREQNSDALEKEMKRFKLKNLNSNASGRIDYSKVLSELA